jgi:hypothetical protein
MLAYLCVALATPVMATTTTLAHPPSRSGDNETLVIYNGALQNGFSDWSWAQVNLANPTPTHGSPTSIRVSAKQWQALFLHHNAFDSDPLDTLQ